MSEYTHVNLHVNGDTRTHTEDEKCKCEPWRKQDPETHKIYFVHRPKIDRSYLTVMAEKPRHE